MHELSFATALVSQIENAAQQQGVTRVIGINVRVGALSGIVEDSLRFVFPLAAQGTLLEGAALHLELVPLRVRCKACLAESEVEYPGMCPCCQALGVEIIQGRDVTIESMEVI